MNIHSDLLEGNDDRKIPAMRTVMKTWSNDSHFTNPELANHNVSIVKNIDVTNTDYDKCTHLEYNSSWSNFYAYAKYW